MLSRKITPLKPTEIPQAWLEEVNAVLKETYHQQCLDMGIKVETYGEIYKDELCIAFSLLEQNNLLGNATTLFTSFDLDNKSDPKSIFDYIFNASSEFFDYIFGINSEEEEVYQAKWKETNFSEKIFFYKISRENLNLTKKANELLAKA